MRSTGTFNHPALKFARKRAIHAVPTMQTARPSSSPTRRRHPRTPVHVHVRWHNRLEEGASAEIHDISAEGLFVVSAHPLPSSIDSGDLVWVVVPTSAGEEVLAGTVRWRGFHPGHEHPGCGIELEPKSSERLQQLFPLTTDPSGLNRE